VVVKMFENVWLALENLAESVVVLVGFEGLVVMLIVGGILGLALGKKAWSLST